MRLKQYLVEITEVSDEEVEKILDFGFDNFRKIRKKSKSWPMLLLKLIGSFKNFSIIFMPSDFFLSKKILGSDVKGYTVMGGKGVPISISVDKNIIRQTSTDAGIQKFKNFIRSTLTHELTHRKQASRMSGSYIDWMNANEKKLKKKQSPESIFKYLSGKIEIEAFARQAVDELENGESEIVHDYTVEVRNWDKKPWRRFLKKLYQYLDLYGSEKSKKNLKKQLSNLKISVSDLLDIQDELLRKYERG